MVVVLMILTFAGFVIVDAVLERRRRAELAREGATVHEAFAREEPRFVTGLKLPRQLHFHPAHTWAHRVTPELAYVGVDDFARRFLGKGTKLRAPHVGTLVRQGEPAVEVTRNGHRTSLVSPVTGEIVAVNPRLGKEPGVVNGDPFGSGWLFKVRSRRLPKDLANLLRDGLAEQWTRLTHERFLRHMMLASGSVIQDGGVLVDDIGAQVDDARWQSLVDEFLEPADAS